MIYDAFSPILLMQLEALGFCGLGEAKDFIADGQLSLEGSLPCNTNGGLIGEGYIHGLNLVLEGVRQLRGTAVNQVPDARTILVTASRTGAILTRPTRREMTMASVLDGIRVLDLSSGVAGPITGMLLADHGAEVIKVEPPGGDRFRGDAGLRHLAARAAQRRARPARRRPTATRFLALARHRRRRAGDLRAGHRRSDWASTARSLLGAEPPPRSSARSPHTARTRRTVTGPATTRSSPPASAYCTSSAVTSAARSATSTARSRSSRTSRSPRAWRRARRAAGPILTYTPWLSMGTAFLATTGDQRRAVRPGADRARPARRDLAAASGVLSQTASKWQRVGTP